MLEVYIAVNDSHGYPLSLACSWNEVGDVFSLRSCRSSSVIFFWFFAGKFGKFGRNFGGSFAGFFLTHRIKAQKFRGKFRGIFRKKIRSSNKIFRAKFTLQTCHLNDVLFAGVLRGNTIRGNTTRNSERKMALWEGLWEGLWKTSENL